MPSPICQALRRGALWLALGMLPLAVYAQPCRDWPLWQDFGSRFIQPDGRVLADESEQHYSTSEGQAYALFFSLVAGDRNRFERILSWTRDNLADGDFGARLPAWQWGKMPDEKWEVLDQNSASDADIWLAYTLLEAGRLWHEPRYAAEGKLLLANIRIHEIRDIPGLGTVLLPAPVGFDQESGGARLNPSYLPVQLLRAFSKTEPSGPWSEVIESNFKLLYAVSPLGFVPDWVSYVPGQGYRLDPTSGAAGTHDAIRVYLWWGMLSGQDPMAARMKKIIHGMNRLIPNQQITPPLAVDTQTGTVSGISPPGFSAALLPYFARMRNDGAQRLQRERLISQQYAATGSLIGQDPRYYDQVLTLFGQGWMEHRFSFAQQGQLVTQRTPSCSAKK